MLLQQTRDISPWQQTDQQIEQWLKQRQTLLVIYNQICQINSSIDSHSKFQTLQTFCQILMDYLSAGHFKIFEQITAAYETNVDALNRQSISHKLFEKILNTTDIALDFNEKYTEPTHLQDLSQDLSKLGENLAHRMEWEDNLVNTYLQMTRH